MERGADVNTLINEERLVTEEFDGTCYTRKDYNDTINANGAFDTDIIFFSRWDCSYYNAMFLYCSYYNAMFLFVKLYVR